jgi:hypothetical protein
MTRVEGILDHVKSRDKTQHEKWKWIMDDCQELAYLTDVVDHTMASIIWRTIENEQTKCYAQEAHLGVDELSLWIIILRTKHLVEKLSKQPRVGKFIHY